MYVEGSCLSMLIKLRDCQMIIVGRQYSNLNCLSAGHTRQTSYVKTYAYFLSLSCFLFFLEVRVLKFKLCRIHELKWDLQANETKLFCTVASCFSGAGIMHMWCVSVSKWIFLIRMEMEHGISQLFSARSCSHCLFPTRHRSQWFVTLSSLMRVSSREWSHTKLNKKEIANTVAFEKALPICTTRFNIQERNIFEWVSTTLPDSQ